MAQSLGKSISFKVSLYAEDGRQIEVRRFGIDQDVATNFDYLQQKLQAMFPQLQGLNFKVSWKDVDADDIIVSSNEELVEALAQNEICKLQVLILPVVEDSVREQECDYSAGAHMSKSKVHEHVICDGCDKEIEGKRFKCLQCEDYDLCSVCETSGIHGDHAMIRMVKPICIKKTRKLHSFCHMSRHLFSDSEEGKRCSHKRHAPSRIRGHSYDFLKLKESLESFFSPLDFDLLMYDDDNPEPTVVVSTGNKHQQRESTAGPSSQDDAGPSNITRAGSSSSSGDDSVETKDQQTDSAACEIPVTGATKIPTHVTEEKLELEANLEGREKQRQRLMKFGQDVARIIVQPLTEQERQPTEVTAQPQPEQQPQQQPIETMVQPQSESQHQPIKIVRIQSQAEQQQQQHQPMQITVQPQPGSQCQPMEMTNPAGQQQQRRPIHVTVQPQTDQQRQPVQQIYPVLQVQNSTQPGQRGFPISTNQQQRTPQFHPGSAFQGAIPLPAPSGFTVQPLGHQQPSTTMPIGYGMYPPAPTNVFYTSNGQRMSSGIAGNQTVSSTLSFAGPQQVPSQVQWSNPNQGVYTFRPPTHFSAGVQRPNLVPVPVNLPEPLVPTPAPAHPPVAERHISPATQTTTMPLRPLTAEEREEAVLWCSVERMVEMGFSNNDGRLYHVLQLVDGNIDRAIERLTNPRLA